MATKKRLDQLPAILSGDVGNNDLMYLVHENAQAETGYDSKKMLVAEVAKKLLGGVELPTDLPDFPANEQNALSALEYLNAKINDLYPVVTESGSLVTFTTPLALPLVSLKANITATQSGTGTPSPSNPRPISGFSSVTLTQKDSEDTTVDTFTISLGDTYYGGVLDCKNGTATIDKKIIDLGDYTFTYNSTYERMSTTLSDLKAVGTVRATPFICSCFQSIDDGRTMQEVPYDSVYAGGAGTTLIYIKTQTTDPDAFKTAVTGQKLVYPIEPITLSGLTPDNFTTIQGENNIFADSGDVELSFRQSIQEYIDAQIATTQALIL